MYEDALQGSADGSKARGARRQGDRGSHQGSRLSSHQGQERRSGRLDFGREVRKWRNLRRRNRRQPQVEDVRAPRGQVLRPLVARATAVQRTPGGHDDEDLVPPGVSREELESLPGVGRKTASVLLSMVGGSETQHALPVDTHIHRLAQRWGFSEPGASVLQAEADLSEAFGAKNDRIPRREWGKLHLRLIYFGREHCPAQRHDAKACPICSWAAAA